MEQHVHERLAAVLLALGLGAVGLAGEGCSAGELGVEGVSCGLASDCQPDLRCDGGRCTLASCADAADPAAWCAARLRLPADQVSCSGDTCLRERGGLMSACGDDLDCEAGLACEASLCQEQCAGDDDCAAGQLCLLREVGPGRLCAPRERLRACSEALAPDAYCQQELSLGPGEAQCLEDACERVGDVPPPDPPAELGEACDVERGEEACKGELVCDPVRDVCAESEPPPPYTTLAVIDTSAGVDACTGQVGEAAAMEYAPGIDLMALELQQGGQTLGWAQAASFVAGMAEADNSFTHWAAVLRGAAPALEVDTACPVESNGVRRRTDSTLSLGCGGEVRVAFVDGDGQAVELAEGQRVRVWTYGRVCDDAAADPSEEQARYELRLCDPDTGDCGVVLGQGAGGLTTFPVALP